MSTLATQSQADTMTTRTATVEVIVPVYNEERDLAASILRLDRFLAATFPYRYQVVIADNASTDSTLEIATRIAQRHDHVRVVHLDAKGRGRALKQVWRESQADVVAYMDVDLSTDLKALLPLVAPLISGHSDVAIGTRLSRSSRVVRGPKREFISRCYNIILRTSLGASFSDAQCGFKAMRRDVAERLLPLVADNNWFFDTELLVLAERSGLRIHEVPVDWVDDPSSSVDIVATALEDLKGVARLLRGFATRRLRLDRVRAEFSRDELPTDAPGVPYGLLSQMIRFAAVGVLSTAAYFLLYLLLRGMGAQMANFLALLLTAIGNTAVNRRFTFKVTGRENAIKHQLGGLAAFGLALTLTSGSLWLLNTYAPTAGRPIEVVVLVVANLAATGLRFLALRLMMHPRDHASSPAKNASTAVPQR